MFSKISRYRAVPDVAVTDARGRVVASKGLRPLPEVTGTFLHTVRAGDRLDHLAFTYYGQSLDYWRICDANPDVLSPLELLDAGPLVTTGYPLTPPAGADPPWAALLRALAAAVGVYDAVASEPTELVRELRTVGGQQMAVVVEYPRPAVTVTYNRLEIGAAQLAALIGSSGFATGPPEETGRAGQPVVIPPAASGLGAR